MVKTYRSVQQWNHWLTHFLGKSVLKTEQRFLSKFCANHYGKHALLIGVPEQQPLLKFIPIRHQYVLGPLINKNASIKYIESEYYELPLLSGSVDLVIVPHTLGFLDNPQKLLNEACRIVKPEGDIIIFGFNPASLWGLKKWLVKNKNAPWSGNFIQAGKIIHWLSLADFELVSQKRLMFRPPIQQHTIFRKLKIMEWLGENINALFGGIFVIIAKAKVTPLTPIKLHWQQKLSTLSVTMPRPTTMRDMQ